MRGRRWSLVACSTSFRRPNSTPRPTKGASKPSERWAPPMPETISRACHNVSGSVLPFSSTSPCRSNSMASPANRRVVVSTRTVPAVAADCTRAAVLTASPATIAWPSALMVAATVPVTTPARAARPGAAIEAPRSATSETSSMAARTARSASPSTATGVPQTAITASPMNFSIVPPYLVTTVRAMSKYRDRSSRTSSGSRPSLSGVKPTRSTNSTEHSRRSVSGPAGARSSDLGRRGIGLDRRPALGAEPQARSERRRAGATHRAQCGSARSAETLPEVGLRATTGARHADRLRTRANRVTNDPPGGIDRVRDIFYISRNYIRRRKVRT